MGARQQLHIGVDPGKSGALAVIDSDGSVVDLQPTPMIRGGQGGRDEYDIRAISTYLMAMKLKSGGALFVTVEKSQPLPPKMGGSIANFQRGASRGWEWLLVALGVSYQLVSPRSWQAAMHAGAPGADTKQRSIIAAQRLFPIADMKRSPRCKGPDDGIAEALLLAEYGRRTHQRAAPIAIEPEVGVTASAEAADEIRIAQERLDLEEADRIHAREDG